MGDPVADLYEDMAAEQKARANYENLIKLTDDVDLQDGLKFLRERRSSISSASARPWTTPRGTWTARRYSREAIGIIFLQPHRSFSELITI